MANSVFMLNEKEKTIPYVLFYDDAGSFVPSHWHKEIEIAYCKKGETNMVINNTVYELKEGDMAVILGGDTHLYFRTQEHERAVLMFDYSVFESYGTDSSQRSDLQHHLKKIPRVSSLWSDEYKKRANIIVHMLENLNAERFFGRDLAIRARLYDFILLLCNEVAVNDYIGAGEDTTTQMLVNLEKIFAFVEEHYIEDINLADAANVLGFTESYFARFFKKHSGETFLTYLNAFRINKARDLLFVDEYPISRISEMVGIPNVKTFNRLFKETFGTSPTRYKKSIFEKN